MHKTRFARSLVAVSTTMFSIALCGGCGCRRSYTDRKNVASTSFAPGASASAATSVDAFRLVALDGKGRADESVATWGDFVLSTSAGSGGTVFLASHAVADAIVATGRDLRSAPGGTLLVGEHFDLECSRQGDGTCLAYDSWVGATASGSIDVVAPTSSPPPLLTFDMSAKVTQSTGDVVTVQGVLTLGLVDEQVETGQSGDCS